MEFPMSETNTVSPLRQRMIEDMSARKLNPNTQRSHIQSCKRFAAWLKRSPDMATPDEVRLFQLHLIESGTSICNRNRIMTGVRFLFRVTLRRHDLAAEVWHIKEPERLPPVLSPEEVKRVLTMATSRSDAAHNASVSSIDAARVHDLRIMVAQIQNLARNATVMLGQSLQVVCRRTGSEVRFGPRLCEKSNARRRRRKFFS